jgi:hypothetical protein
LRSFETKSFFPSGVMPATRATSSPPVIWSGNLRGPSAFHT